MKNKILVTGFKPFGGEAVNPSELLLAGIDNAFPGIDPIVHTLTLPVSYQNSFLDLKNQWVHQGPYDAVLMLGQAGGRKQVCLERVALNWTEASPPDEDGMAPETGKILPHAGSACIVDFFPTAWKTELAALGPAAISHSAGTFVCNALYFKAQQELPKETDILFTHVPYLPEQLTGKAPGTPALAFDIQLKMILKLLDLLRNR